MEPPQTKPPKKRRRWLIVAFVLVLLSLVSWWYYPRGDARFVGTWRVTELRNRQTADVGWLDLRRNGSLRWSIYQPSDFRPIEWRVENDRVVFSDSFARFPPPVLQFFSWFRTSVMGNSAPVGTDATYSLVSWDRDTIVLQYVGTPVSVTLRRIPE
jgi:hypothetical protein